MYKYFLQLPRYLPIRATRKSLFPVEESPRNFEIKQLEDSSDTGVRWTSRLKIRKTGAAGRPIVVRD